MCDKLRPSKIREIDIVEARLAITRARRKAKGGAGETTKADEIAELLVNEKQKAKGNASSGKRAKVKSSQRKGYG